MKKMLAVILSVIMALTCCTAAFAAEKTITNPASAYAPYDTAAVAGDNTAGLTYDQIAGIILDWLDRRIADEAADFNAFTESVGVDLSITGVDSLVAMKDHIAELGGDFANLNTDAIVTRKGGDVNFFYGIFQFMADNADVFGKVFRWDDQVFDYGKVGEYIETLEDGAPGDFLALFEVKEDAIAGGVPVTYALINASDYIVDAFFPDTVEAQLYTASETVQEEFTGSASDQGIAARNMVSINGRREHILPALLDLVRESGLLADFACDHANTEAIPAVAATCTAAGKTEGLKCADCGKVITAQEEVPALGHADDNNDGVCDRCETVLTPDDNGQQDDQSGKTGIAGIWQKIVDFFQKIVNFFKNLFNRG